MFDDQEAVFGEFEDENEQAARDAVDEDVADGAAPGVLGRIGGGVHGKE